MTKHGYSIGMRRGQPHMAEAPRKSNRLHAVVTVALAVALAVTLWVCLPAMSYRGDARSLFISRMQTECDTALTYSKYLSRTASSNSNAQLAVIRSCVYGMDVLNQSYAGLEGEGHYLVDQALFSQIYGVLDSYFNKLTTGMNTSDQLTELSASLEALQQAVITLD